MISEDTITTFNQKLQKNNLTIFCAESITAGLLASSIASVSGASMVLKGSIVTYDEKVKTKILGVSEEILKEHSAESQETTTAMCGGLKALYPGVSIYVTVTGVASAPAPGSGYILNKKVGQVYVTVFYKNEFHEFPKLIKPEEGGNYTRNEIREKNGGIYFSKD